MRAEDELNLIALRQAFIEKEGAFAVIGIRGRDAGDLSEEARGLLRGMGFDLGFPHSPVRRIVEGDGGWAARRLLEAGVPFVYAVMSERGRHPHEVVVSPGRKMDADRAPGAFGAMAEGLSPAQMAIVQGKNAREMGAILEETTNIRAAEAREEHPRTIVAGGDVYRICPEIDPDRRGMFRGGFGGAGWTITYGDGHQVHTTNLMHQGKAEDVRFLPNATLTPDPWRQSTEDYDEVEYRDRKYEPFIRGGSFLVQPSPVGSEGKSKAIRWDDPRAVAFVDRETASRLSQRGAPRDAMGRNAPGPLEGNLVLRNERWIAVRDDQDVIHARRVDDPAIIDAALELILKHRFDEEPRVRLEVGDDGLVKELREDHEWRKERSREDVARSVARHERRGEWLRELAAGTLTARSIPHAIAILKTEPQDLDERFGAVMTEAQDMTDEVLRRREDEAISFVRGGLSALMAARVEAREAAKSIYGEDDLPAFDPEMVALSARGIHVLWNLDPCASSSEYENDDRQHAVGKIETDSDSGRKVLRELGGTRKFDCQETDLEDGDFAFLRAIGTREKMTDETGDWDYAYKDLRTLGVYPLKKPMDERAELDMTDIVRSMGRRRDFEAGLTRLAPYADLRNCAKVLDGLDGRLPKAYSLSDNGSRTMTIIAFSERAARSIYSSEAWGGEGQILKSGEATPLDLWLHGNGRPERAVERALRNERTGVSR